MRSTACVRWAAALAVLLLGTSTGRAAEWPSQPVNVIVPFSAGGSTDVLARLAAQHLQERLGQPFIVQNKSGAGGALGSAAVAKAEPDGYTLLVGTGGSHVTAPLTSKTPAFDPEKDLAPVTLMAKLPSLLVIHPSIPAHTVPELVAYLKANPGKVSYGSSGTGTASQLGVELFKTATGTQMTHVPFRSTGDNANSLAGGHTQLAMDIISVLLPQAQAGVVRAIAVTGKDRIASAPEIPTLRESIPGFEITAWIGMFAPAGTPPPIIEKLASEMRAVLALPDVEANLASAGAVPAPTTPNEFAAFIKAERETWTPVIRDMGLIGSN